MTVSALEGPVADLYQQAVKQLKTGDNVHVSQFESGKYESGPRKMTSVMNHLCSPSSHQLRVNTGLTRLARNQWTGCVLRIAPGTYRWLEHQRLADPRTLIDPPAGLIVTNRKWSMQEGGSDRVEPTIKSEIATIVNLRDNLMMVVEGDLMYICEIIEVVKL